MSNLRELKDKILAAFECQGSGNCCRAEGFVRIDQENLEQMASIMAMTPQEFKSRYVIVERGWMMISTPRYRPDCFLDAQHNCRVYDGRPAACRSYPNWPTIWESDSTILSEIALCPGLRTAYETVCNPPRNVED